MTSTAHMIKPDDERYCIWMDAGLVNFKLCDLDFDCEHCPFDAVIRTHHVPHTASESSPSDKKSQAIERSEGSNEISVIVKKILETQFESVTTIRLPEDRFYFRNHTWVLPLNHGECLVGVDHLAGTVLPPVYSCIIPHIESKVSCNDPLIWIVRNKESIAVAAPLTGTVVESNPKVASQASLIGDDPYGDGWLIKMQMHKPIECTKPYEPVFFKTVIEQDVEQMEHFFIEECARSSPSTPTMYDGGTPIQSIEKLIGTKRYNELVTSLITMKRG